MRPCSPRVIFFKNEFRGNIVISISGDINKVEAALHIGGHISGEARKLLPDILFECSAAPAAHLLNLRVRVSREG